jgi:hypothetical protein
LIATYDLPWSFDQVLGHHAFAPGQGELAAGPLGLEGTEVDLPPVERVLAGRLTIGVGQPGLAPENPGDPGQQFFECERLSDVIVAADHQALDPVGLAPRRDEHDGTVSPCSWAAADAQPSIPGAISSRIRCCRRRTLWCEKTSSMHHRYLALRFMICPSARLVSSRPAVLFHAVCLLEV